MADPITDLSLTLVRYFSLVLGVVLIGALLLAVSEAILERMRQRTRKPTRVTGADGGAQTSTNAF